MPPVAEYRLGAAAARAAGETIATARSAQRDWALRTVSARMQVLRRFRGELAAGARELATTVATSYPGSLHRTEADTLVTEVLPLAEACRFLEREAAWTLRTQRESAGARPFWLRGVEVEIERVALGVVLVLGPANYPLFLPGAQVLQALAAGNAVLWKPADTGAACAHAMRVMLIASGVPPELLAVLDPSPAHGVAAIEAGVDKVFLTGSSASGEAVLQALAPTATPAVMELSGCDAVFVLEGADLDRCVEALAFGLRLNGSATCMAPRRVFVAAAIAEELAFRLIVALRRIEPVPLSPRLMDLLRDLVAEASLEGAHIALDGLSADEDRKDRVGATLLTGVTPRMRVTQTDVFAPVLSLLAWDTPAEAAALYEQCPYALTAAIFGPEAKARTLARQITAGTVIFNDLIAPTADPRVPFGGRKRSGFGSTRGREGLLAMTAPRAVVRQRSRSRRAYQPAGAAHAALFLGYTQAAHARTWRERLGGFRAIARALPALRSSNQSAITQTAKRLEE